MSLEFNPLWFGLLSLGLALVPLMAAMLSSYIRVSIVLNMFRSGLGAQGVPGTLVIMSLASALTMFIMGPVFERSASGMLEVTAKHQSISLDRKSLQRFEPVITPWRDFLSRHVGARELETLRDLRAQAKGSDKGTGGREEKNETNDLSILVPAFVLSELRHGFSMGFSLLIPFLVVDLIVANLLSGLGMMMASPAMIALPIKVLLFLLADGWVLLTRSLVLSFNGVA
ncbi:MAG: EscR/YscR/HrcR family type III secretion system export apparatus protein [Oligoflexia bacterium]|nr:EscR/YscR/HrcR family type III secretion system export apparatus protein [Oligoflexia bacterium]